VFYVYVVFILAGAGVDAFYNALPPRMKDFFRICLGFLLVVRILTSGAIAVVVALPMVWQGTSLTHSLACALPFFLAAAGGFALNDYYDFQKDLLNKPYRAIPSRKLSRRSVLVTSVVLMVFACVSAFIAFNSRVEGYLFFVSILGVSTYNLFVRYLTASKGVITAVISTTPAIYVVMVLKYPTVYLLVPVAMGIFLLGREWLMDIRDMHGDGEVGNRTLPVIFGAGRTAILGFIALFSSSIVLMSFAFQTKQSWHAIIAGSIAICVAVLIPVWIYQCGRYRRTAVLSLWLPMILGISILLK
jgi:4-hydroxybenzoate polyprenyltransferase